MQASAEAKLLEAFRKSLMGDDRLERLRTGVIGEGRMIPGPNGPQPLLYADYIASGRALRQVETFMMEEVLPFYANTHTEGSYCGGFSTRLREAARAFIGQECGADGDHAVVFCGSGATGGLNRLVHLLGVTRDITEDRSPLILIGPYEHHSNILPWRESGAEVVEIPESPAGGPDMAALQAELIRADDRLVIASFSAASNVTGILTDVAAVTRLLKAYGALSIWDYAGGGPYIPISMSPAEGLEIDAIVLSPHKFLGGPGASGVMIIRHDALRKTRPTQPGGGTVRFVSPWATDYSTHAEDREEAGTPNVVGDIRAALAFAVKSAIGTDFMTARHADLIARARAVWDTIPGLRIVGNPAATDRLPVFSVRIEAPDRTEFLHHQRVTRVLSDYFGIQARGGCACAGPYGHRLLGIDQSHSEAIRHEILAGNDLPKPGWTRLNFSSLMTDAKADRLITAVAEIALNPEAYAEDCADQRTKGAA